MTKAESYGVKEATKLRISMRKDAKRAYQSVERVTDKGDVFATWNSLNDFIADFGTDLVPEAKTLQQELEKDPTLQKEIRAKEIYLKIQGGFRQNGPQKTASYLERLIAEFPDTAAAKQAQSVLNKIQQSAQ